MNSKRESDICPKCGDKYEDILGIGKCGACWDYYKPSVNGDKQEAKEKAKELVERFRFYVIGQPDGHAELQNAKQCALICLTEIEQALTDYGRETDELQNMDRTFHHLDNIKTEITNL